MIKNLTSLETQLDNRTYSFYCDNSSPIAHVKEALFQITKLIGQIEESIAAQQKAAEETKEETGEPEAA
jgi:hypothetical protein